VRDDNGDLLADSHNILKRWKNYFPQLLHVQVHRVSDVRQIEIHTAEPLVPDPSPLVVEFALQVEKYKSPGNDQIPTELIQAGSETLLSEIHKRIKFICNKEELPDQWKELSNIPLSRLSPHVDEIIGDHQCVFQRNSSTTDQFFLHSSDTGEKMGVQ
jgi:hypothetical protein